MDRRLGLSAVTLVVFAIVATVFVLSSGAPDLPPGSRGTWISLHNLGIAHMNRFEMAAAEKIYERLVARFPDDPVPWINLGIAQLNQAGKEPGENDGPTRAEKSLQRARELAPTNPRVSYCLGIIYYFQGRLKETCQQFAEAVGAIGTRQCRLGEAALGSLVAVDGASGRWEHEQRGARLVHRLEQAQHGLHIHAKLEIDLVDRGGRDRR